MVGKTIASYRLTAILGEGGFGSVYRAEHVQIGRPAAIKLLHPRLAHDGEVVARFLNEARAAAAVRHENIVEIFDAGLAPDGTPFIAMELLTGEPLNARLAHSGRLAPDMALAFALQTAAALSAAHAAGIVHRDLKPENLFVVPGDPQERIKVLDFGIAKLRDRDQASPFRTRDGSCMGSPAYMSPEQWQGRSDVDLRTDVYALGVILYEMLSGSPPFLAADIVSIQSMHLTASPAPLRLRNPAVTEVIDESVLRALAKDPRDRFADMDELARALIGGTPPPRRAGGTVLLPPMSTGKTSGTRILPQGSRAGASTRLSPAQASGTRSTLSQGAGELAHGSDAVASVPTRRRAGIISALAALALVIGAVGLFALVRSPGIERRSEVAPGGEPVAPVRVPRAAAAPPAPEPPPVTPALDPKPIEPPPLPSVTIQIDSEPAEAEVTNASDNRRLGRTPFSISVPTGSSPLRLRITKDGYQATTELVTPDHDETRTVMLHRVESRPTPVPTKRLAL